ncbi:hypothetical protein [Marinicauda salina]|nr:hypothetical protein [Marinicauda salina]
MGQREDSKSGSKQPADDREDRLAEALRKNLRRRKAAKKSPAKDKSP